MEAKTQPKGSWRKVRKAILAREGSAARCPAAGKNQTPALLLIPCPSTEPGLRDSCPDCPHPHHLEPAPGYGVRAPLGAKLGARVASFFTRVLKPAGPGLRAALCTLMSH